MSSSRSIHLILHRSYLCTLLGFYLRSKGLSGRFIRNNIDSIFELLRSMVLKLHSLNGYFDEWYIRLLLRWIICILKLRIMTQNFGRRQCDQMIVCLFNIWPFKQLKFVQWHIKIAKISSKFCQILNSHFLIGQRIITVCQSGENSANMVTPICIQIVLYHALYVGTGAWVYLCM